VDRVAEGEAPVWSTGQSWEQRLKAVTHLLGVEVSRWRPPERRLAEYLETHDIRNVLDVGANGGQFGQMLRAAGFRGRIVSFEPLRTPFEVLSRAAAPDLMWEVHRLALGDAPGRRVMNVSTNTTSSSFLDIEKAHTDALAAARFVASEEVDVARLDEVAESLRLAGQTLLKLDVQGYHLAVLRGAAGMLDAVTAIQCEVSILPLYAGEPVLLDVLAELRESGFELTELEPGFYDPRTGRILQFDGRFSRPSAGEVTPSQRAPEVDP
jgi:FkbM family methyltransferase